MISPIASYPGKVGGVSSAYPYGEARNVTAPGDGTGTPWEGLLVNDIFGFQQASVSEAGITPSGSPETATASQHLESLRIITNMRTVTHNMTLDANYALTTDQNKKRRIIITDTGVLLSATRSVIVDNLEKEFVAQNDTAQTLLFRTSGGTGITVLAGEAVKLYNDGTNVIIISQEIGVVDQSWQDVTGSRVAGTVYTNTTGKPIVVNISLASRASALVDLMVVDGIQVATIRNENTATGIYGTWSVIVPNGSTYNTTATAVLQVWAELR